MNTATFGLVGAGHHSEDQHLPNLKRAPHIDFKSVCDLDETKLRKVQEKYKIPHATTDFRELLADDGLQAVVISTKEDAQAPLTIKALQAGKYVYVEKPLANTVEECRAVVEAERNSGKYACVGFNRRRAPAYRQAKELVRLHGGAWNIHYRISDEYWNWGKHLKPGTRVIHELCHIFDIIRWFTDSEVKSVYCLQSRPDDEGYLLQMATGCVVTLMNSGHVTWDFPKERVEIVTARGAMTIEEFVELRTFGLSDAQPMYRYPGHTHPHFGFMHKYLLEKQGAEALHAIRRIGWELREKMQGSADLTNSEREEIRKFLEEEVLTFNYLVDKGWLSALEHMAESILEGKKPQLATAYDGLKAIEIAHAAIRSRQTGQIVHF